MTVIGIIVLFFLSAYIPAWLGAIFAAFVLVNELWQLIQRIWKHQPIKLANSAGILTFCVFFIWLMMR